MRNIWLRLLISGLFFLTLTNSCLAKDKSALILVSCTIPAIPGINAPKDSNPIALEDKNTKEIKKEVKTEKEENSLFLQKKEKIENRDSILLLTSIYAR